MGDTSKGARLLQARSLLPKQNMTEEFQIVPNRYRLDVRHAAFKVENYGPRLFVLTTGFALATCVIVYCMSTIGDDEITAQKGDSLPAGVLVSDISRGAHGVKANTNMELKHHAVDMSKTKESLKKHDAKLKSLKALQAKLLAKMNGAKKPSKPHQAFDMNKTKESLKKHDAKLKSLKALKAKLIAKMGMVKESKRAV